ncbi:MAG: hypothetical protein R2799_09515 [Crocinitomicaceae bacterium]
MLTDILERSKEEQEIIGLWTYDDEDGFWSGYVVDFNEEMVVFKHFTKYGKSDGIIIESMQNIASIDFNDDYSKCMAYIIKNAEKLELQEDIQLNIKDIENWHHEVLADQIANPNRIVRMIMESDETYCGLVEWVDDENLVIRLIDKEGQDEGNTLFRLEDIKTLRINDLENRRRLLLYNWKHQRI